MVGAELGKSGGTQINSMSISIPTKIDEIIAKVQTRMATFLQCREKLTRMASSVDIGIADKAVSLLEEQTKLETELSANLTRIEQIKSTGQWAWTDITGLGMFYYNVERHISGTGDLWKKAGNTAEEASPNWLAWGLAGLVIVLLLRRR